MFIIFLFILFSLGFGALYLVTPFTDNLWLLFAWVPGSILLGLLCVVLFLILFFLYGSKTNPKRKFRHIILRNICWLGMKFLHIKMIVINKENVPTDQSYVLYGNHKSNMDPLFLIKAVRGICSAIGKKSLFKHPIMRIFGATYGAIPLDRENDREAAKSISLGVKRVKSGISMIIFPEGGIKTRETEEMSDLRPGAYKLAIKAEAPIVPVSIVGSSKIKDKKRRKKHVVKVIFHKPIYKEQYSTMNTTEVGQMVEAIINEGVRQYS